MHPIVGSSLVILGMTTAAVAAELSPGASDPLLPLQLSEAQMDRVYAGTDSQTQNNNNDCLTLCNNNNQQNRSGTNNGSSFVGTGNVTVGVNVNLPL
jgi:hypothetical protein